MRLQELAAREFIKKNDNFSDEGVLKMICETILYIPFIDIKTVKDVREMYERIYKGDLTNAIKTLALHSPVHLDFYLSKTHPMGYFTSIIELVEQGERSREPKPPD